MYDSTRCSKVDPRPAAGLPHHHYNRSPSVRKNHPVSSRIPQQAVLFLGLMSEITQSLAGRTSFIELLPFSVEELDNGQVMPSDLDTMLFNGGYPPLYDRALSPHSWFPAYVTAYIERDVRQLLKVWVRLPNRAITLAIKVYRLYLIFTYGNGTDRRFCESDGIRIPQCPLLFFQPLDLIFVDLDLCTNHTCSILIAKVIVLENCACIGRA